MSRSHAAPLLLLAVVLTPFAVGRAVAEDVKWRHDYAAARKEAAEAGRPLVLKFSTDWCGPCRKLEATTLREPKVVAALNEKFIPVKLDGDKEADLMAEFKVTGFPTVLVVSPDGKVIGRTSGFRTATELAAILDKAPEPTPPTTKSHEGKKGLAFDADQAVLRQLTATLNAEPAPRPEKKTAADGFDADRELHRKLATALDRNR